LPRGVDRHRHPALSDLPDRLARRAYAATSMSDRAGPSPLAGAVLALVDDGVAPSELVTRLAAHGAAVDEPTATSHLLELSDLGLVQRVSGGNEANYELTTLGRRLLRASFTANPDRADMLAEIEQTRTELLSTIAHELRTPLTAVRSSVGLLLDPGIVPSSEEREQLLLTIERNASRMQRVVGDILDLARFRAGRVQLQLRRFDARELASAAISSIAPLAGGRRQTIDLLAPDDPVPVFADYRRLEQALVNLLSNAVKYSSDETPITVTVGSTEDNVSWAVADRGRGIPPEDQVRLFEQFFVADRDHREAPTGVGLGLPISLVIVEAHGGRIDVESRVGAGSTFTIIVPTSGPREVPE